MKNSTQPPPNPTLSIDIKLRKILRLKCSFVLIFRHPFKCRLVTTTMLSFNPIPSQLSFINLQLVYICITTTEKILEYAMKKSNYITYVLLYSLYSSFMASCRQSHFSGCEGSKQRRKWVFFLLILENNSCFIMSHYILRLAQADKLGGLNKSWW